MKVLHNQKGFTLIELIIVIVVLGLLAAVAIPQYVNLTQDAQQASNMGYIAGARSSVAISFAGQRLGRTVGAGFNQVCIDATTIAGPAVPAATTNAAVQSCITGSLPSSLAPVAGPPSGWDGAAALTAGGLGTTQHWQITAGANTGDPVRITCTIGSMVC